LTKPSFMPLNIKEHVNILQNLSTHPNIPLFTQILLCKRQWEWRENAINQYVSYKRGNDYPFENSFLLSIQNKLLKAISILDNQAKRESIQEIEDKILQDNYRFEFRIILFQKNCHQFEALIGKEFKKL